MKKLLAALTGYHINYVTYLLDTGKMPPHHVNKALDVLAAMPENEWTLTTMQTIESLRYELDESPTITEYEIGYRDGRDDELQLRER